VDSALLAYEAHRVLGADALCVTAVSASYPQNHREMAERIVRDFELPHRFVETDEMQNPSYRANASDRCYHCKSALFERLDRLAAEERFDAIAYGINADDTADFRPGHRAAAEHKVLSPLLAAGLSKAEVRALSRAAGLPTWDLPASACLSSRLPYGSEVTPEKLRQVEQGEERLRALGFEQIRLRHHGDVARIEVAPAEMDRALDATMISRMTEAIKPLGFRWVSLDLEGYVKLRNDGFPDDQARALATNFNVRLTPGQMTVRNGFCPVEGVGFGCVLTRRDLLQRMAESGVAKSVPTGKLAKLGLGPTMIDFFGEIRREDGSYLSEDYSFCQRVRDMGETVWGLADEKLGHVGNFEYGASFLARLQGRQALKDQKAAEAKATEE